MNRIFVPLRWRYAAIAGSMLSLVLYWMLCSGRPYSVYHGVPLQTAVLLEFQGFQQAIEAPAPGAAARAPLPDMDFAHKARAFATQTAALFRHDTTVREAFRGKTLLAAFSLQAADSLHPLLVLDAGGQVNMQELINGLQGVKRVFPADYRGHLLYTIYLQNGQQLVAGASRNLLLFSRFSYLVEDAFAQLESGGSWWTHHCSEKTNLRTPGAVGISVHIETLAERLRAHVLPAWQWLPDHLARTAEGLRLSREPGGAWKTSVTLKADLPVTAPDNRPADAALYAFLPENTALLSHAFLTSPASISAFFNDKTNPADFETYIQPWLSDEFAWFITEPYSPGMTEDRFIVLGARDTALARQHLERYGTQKGLVKRYDYQTFAIHQFLSPSLLLPLGNGLAEHIRNPVCVQLGRYTVWASNTSAIELLIDQYVVSQTLGHWPDFLQLQTQAGSPGGLFLYFNSAYLPLFLDNIFGKNGYAGVAAGLPAPGLLGLNFMPDGGKKIAATAAFADAGESKTGAGMLWKTPLEADAAGAPAIVRLAGENPETAILIQDANRQLYRFSEGGAVVWRKQLDQPILSDIHAVDFYKNGRLHYLFNTADAIWILDDEGREIEGFPLKLQSAATNGVLVADFFQTRNYSLFISCANGNTYGFDQFGRPLPGWNPRPGTGQVQFPMIHFRWEDKDFLATLSREGKLSVFNQQGTPHFPPVQLEGRYTHTPPQFDDHPKTPRIVCANNAGKAYVCNLEGKTFGLQWSEKAKEPASLILEDFEGDKRKDFLVSRGKTLQLHVYEQKELKPRPPVAFPVPLDTLFYAEGFAGGINTARRQIWLFGKDGKIHPGFPLAGTTPFSVLTSGLNRKTYFLIVGNGAALYAYRINQATEAQGKNHY